MKYKRSTDGLFSLFLTLFVCYDFALVHGWQRSTTAQASRGQCLCHCPLVIVNSYNIQMQSCPYAVCRTIAEPFSLHYSVACSVQLQSKHTLRDPERQFSSSRWSIVFLASQMLSLPLRSNSAEASSPTALLWGKETFDPAASSVLERVCLLLQLERFFVTKKEKRGG